MRAFRKRLYRPGNSIRFARNRDPSMSPDAELHDGASGPRRILKVRLPQNQVIRLHEMRILESTSIAALLEHILEDYFERHPMAPGSVTPMSGNGASKNHGADAPQADADPLLGH